MKKSSEIYRQRFHVTPMTFWVHRSLEDGFWLDSKTFEPPLPRPIGGRGWLQLAVEFNGVRLVFSSVDEFDHFIDILGRNPLPTTRRLSELRQTTVGPNGHWLSRLPAKAKPLRFRRRLVAYLRSVRPAVWALR